ncbi:hypothetical protein QE152_g35859 [Popillia japonica]|uniref:Uncharacterized protein n=1 Tax=Popillia japonica TaxID=7064 RepID=A0AAW1IF07_POPJA
MRELPLEVQGLSQTILPSFLGGSTTLIMAIFAYISDVSTMEMRTLRIGIIQIILTVCSLLSALGGYLFTVLGYYGVLGIGGAMYLAAFCYGIFFVQESSRRPRYKHCKMFFKDVFDPMHAINTLKLLIKGNNQVNRGQLYLVMMGFFISSLVVYGEASVFILFALGTYGFTPVEYSYYDSIKNLLTVIGTIVFLPLFTKVFKLHDAVIIVITFLDKIANKIASNILLILFANTYGLYAGTIVANCHTIANTALRSLMTKSVQVKDLAKALSLLSLCVILFSGCCIIITALYVCYHQMFHMLEPEKKEPPQPLQDKQTALSQTTKL